MSVNDANSAIQSDSAIATGDPGQLTLLTGETSFENVTVPEQIAQEFFFDDGDITHMSARPYNGIIQGSLKNPNLIRVYETVSCNHISLKIKQFSYLI